MNRKGSWSSIFADWPAKMLSLAAALLLFFFYRLNRLEERFVSVPLAVTVNDQYVPSSALPRSVRLTLRGESSSLVTILEEDLKASVDFSDAKAEGLIRSAVLVEKRGTALGVDPLEISVEPVEVTVNLERKARKMVPITPSFRGYLEPGYELSTFDLIPSEAEISGPAGAVSHVLDLSTDFIELSGRHSDFSAEVRVFPKDPLVTISGKASSTFKAIVQQAIEYRRFEGVTVLATGLQEGLALAEPLPTCSIRLQSSKAQLRGFELPPGLAILDLASVRKSGVYTLPLL
ncbi:MAG: CdaR family protein, partial [Spirochaetota bacterium]